MRAEIKEKCDALAALCRQYGVARLEVFGSAADGTWDHARSDIDLLVEFLPKAAASAFGGYFDLKAELQQLIQHQRGVGGDSASCADIQSALS